MVINAMPITKMLLIEPEQDYTTVVQLNHGTLSVRYDMGHRMAYWQEKMSRVTGIYATPNIPVLLFYWLYIKHSVSYILNVYIVVEKKNVTYWVLVC